MAELRCDRCEGILTPPLGGHRDWHWYDEEGFIDDSGDELENPGDARKWGGLTPYHEVCAPDLALDALRDCCPDCEPGEPCSFHE
ncbi:MAG TPA: hypothetical protein VMW52_01485 [Phycisphaerae bacterium]|nr:hypothetical protein [Phycisphaerae bacterium]